ncbi:MAG: hypothetical protein ACYDDU_01495 [Dermatophilaceae bacterium]
MAVALTVEPAGFPVVARLLRDYFTEVMDRYIALRGGGDDVDETMAADPSDDLLMVAARLDGVPVESP